MEIKDLKREQDYLKILSNNKFIRLKSMTVTASIAFLTYGLSYEKTIRVIPFPYQFILLYSLYRLHLDFSVRLKLLNSL